MTQDQLIRLAALGVFITTLGISATFRARAERQGGPLPKDDGDRSVLWRSAVGLPVLAAILASVLAPHRVSWMLIDLSPTVRWFGLGLGAACVPLVYWVMRSLGTNVSPRTTTRAGASLVTHGPYRYVRHPLYTVGTMFVAGLALSLRNGGLLLAWLALLVWLPFRIGQEEARLIGSFGDTYRRYMKNTGRLLPRVRARVP